MTHPGRVRAIGRSPHPDVHLAAIPIGDHPWPARLTPTPLPAQPTPLFGRDETIADLIVLAGTGDARLITLVGPGGVGKTRLCVAVAGQLIDSFRDGVAFIDLTTVRDADLVPSAIARGLGLREAAASTSEDQIHVALRSAEILLVLDNLEQVAAASASIARLLETCSGVVIIASSRQALRVRWEHVREVSPLPLPDIAGETVDAIDASPATRLFVSRARALSGEYPINAADVRDIAAICARVDGLPLAIELAAAHTRVLTPRQILDRMEPLLDFLSDGTADQPDRHRTMRATLDWSYDLLGEDERRVFRRLGLVYEFDLATAEALCADDRGVPSTVASLVGKALLRRERTARGVRFAMLAPVREYAHALLVAAGERNILLDRLVNTFVAVADEADAALRGEAQSEWSARLERDLPNIRVALAWAAERPDPTDGLRIASGLWRFWEVRGHVREGRSWLERLRTRGRANSWSIAGRSAFALGHLAFLQGDYTAARAHHEEGLRHRMENGDSTHAAESLNGLGLVATYTEEMARARQLFEDAAALNRASENRAGEALNINNLGRVAFFEGRLDDARLLQEWSVATRRELGDLWGQALSQADLGDVLVGQGWIEEAEDALRESLAIWHRQENHWGVAYALEGLAGVALARNDARRALTLTGAAAAIRARLEEPPSPPRGRAIERVAQRANALLASADATEALRAGQVMTIDAATEFAERIVAPSGRGAPDGGPLSDREIEVARLVTRGLTNRQIGEELVISERTADAHVARIFRKIGVNSRAQLVAWTLRRGLA
ncbi:MAG: hypothetical protein EPO26_17775 [Chloroflexota bacterium]|nr:MAG: hypothetical protein EPO26_17775 [Chloroflexota bacterium]